MKKWLLFLSIGAILASLTACASGGGGETAEKQTKDGKTLLTMSVQESSPYYETLEKTFEAKNPDIDLEIHSYKNVGEKWGPGDFEKYQKTTNTAMLSGKGMDIIEMGGLPLEDYVSKKLLLNMNDRMEQDQTLDKNDMMNSVLDVLKLDGGLYTVPSGYFVRTFVGDGDILKSSQVKLDDKTWDWKEFERVSKEMIQQAEKSGKKNLYALAFYPPDILLQEMLVDNYAQFVDNMAKKAKFDSPEFVTMLEQIKSMYDNKIVTEESAEEGQQLFYSSAILSPTDFIEWPYMLFDNPAFIHTPRSGKGDGERGSRVIPASQFAIHAKSPVQDEAWKLITFMLSEEGQTMQEREGFSLLKSVNEKNMNDLQKRVTSGEYKLSTGEAPKVTGEQFDVMKQLILNANEYAGLNGEVLMIAGEESQAYFSGQKSAEEVAKLIQNRTTTYLNE